MRARRHSTRSADWPRSVAIVMLLLLPPLLASVWHAAMPGLLGFDRAAIGAGELWRLLSAHYVHLNMAHALMNLAALTLVFALLHRAATPVAWCAVYAVTGLAISLALLWLDPVLARYVGASGVIHGLIAFGALRRLRAAGAESLVLLAGLAIKLAYESQAGPIAGSEALIGAPVIVQSHLYGAIAGGLIGLGSIGGTALQARFSRPEDL